MESSDSESESCASSSSNVEVTKEDAFNNTEVLRMEHNESDSEVDVTNSSDNDYNYEFQGSPIHIGPVNIGPVFSLKCLHDDDDDDDGGATDVADAAAATAAAEDAATAAATAADDDNENYELQGSPIHIGPVNIGPVFSLKCLHDDDDDNNDNEDSNSVPFKIVAVNSVSCTPQVPQPESAIPARNNWEGDHNFQVTIQCNDIPKKSDNTIFTQNKLYVSKDYPFKVLVYAENVPCASYVKVSAVFAMNEHAYDVLHRCPTHAQADFAKGNPAYEHFVQSFSKAAIYTKNIDTGNLCVSLPYEEPQEGETYTSYLFKLTCFSSCSGGINRRPFLLVFSLEKDNICLGRQTIETKVCACPQRDVKVDSCKPTRKRPRTDSPNKSSADGEAVKPKYAIRVKDRELYMFLTEMKYFYEIASKLQSDENAQMSKK